MDCENTYDHYQMDFDHRPGEVKKEEISRIKTFKLAKEEMLKCDLVCSNCHRVRTWNRRQTNGGIL